MKSILLTGSNGFIGRNILPMLREVYSVSAPSRTDLDLLDANALQRYLDKGQYDAVVHLANPTGHSNTDPHSELFERSIRVFVALSYNAGLYGKMVYLGTGAEYGKHRDISAISEEAFGCELPKDAYGLSRYIMSQLAERHDNIINLRLFACCGPGDLHERLIPYIKSCIKAGEAIKLKQNAWFDYLYVEDVFPVLTHFIDNSAVHKAYNLCSGERVLVSFIAEEVRRQIGSKSDIVFENDGLNFEYTASNARLLAEMPEWKPRPIDECIREILKRET